MGCIMYPMQTLRLNTMIFSKSTLATAFAAVVLGLAGCGGGGGGSSSAASATNYTATCADSTTQTSTVSNADALGKCPVPVSTIVNAALPVASTYAANGLTEELAAFNLLNSERSRCGFGTLKQNAALDAAAKAHADWQNLNYLISHGETPNTPGFTGIAAGDQIAAAGYGAYGDVGGPSSNFFGYNSKVGLGASSVRSLLNAPYHLRDMLAGYRDMGVSIRSSSDVSSAFNAIIAQFDMAYTSSVGRQLQSADQILTYPCEGTTGTDIQLTGESPNPVPGRDLSVNPLGGSVFIQLRYGNTLAITSATMIQVSNGSTVILRTPVTSANSGNAFISHQGYVAADAPLLPNTAYQVTINGTNNGTAFSRTFTFTTGTGG